MKRKAAIAIAAPLLHAAAYGLANRFPLGPARELPLTALDRLVPFVPETVWIYVSDYLLLLVAFLVCRDTLRFAGAFLTVIAVCVLTQWLVPIAFPRALFPVDPSAGVSAWAVSVLWSLDAPTSCLPSLHVGMAAMAALSVARSPPVRAPRATTALIAIWAAAVCASTLTVKQHYAVDVAAGLAVAAAVHVCFAPRHCAT